MPEHTAEQVKALISPERAAALDPAKESFTTEELTELLKPVAAESATAPTVAEQLVALLSGATGTAPATETAEQKADREAVERVAAIKAREEAAPLTLAKLNETLETFGTSLIEKVKGESIETARRSGGIQRRGLAEKAEALVGSRETRETDPEALAKMEAPELGQHVLSVFDSMLPQSA